MLSIEAYSNPTPPATDGTGNIRSSYEYNPRMVKAGSDPTRRYQKVSDVKVRDIFMTDYLECPAGSGPPKGVPFNPQTWANWPSRGVVVAYTDTSVSFVVSQDGFTLATQNLITDESTLSAQLYDILWNCYQNPQ